MGKSNVCRKIMIEKHKKRKIKDMFP